MWIYKLHFKTLKDWCSITLQNCKLQKVEQKFTASEQVDKIYIFNLLIPSANCKHTEHRTLILVHKLKEHGKLSSHLIWTLRLKSFPEIKFLKYYQNIFYIDYLREEHVDKLIWNLSCVKKWESSAFSKPNFLSVKEGLLALHYISKKRIKIPKTATTNENQIQKRMRIYMVWTLGNVTVGEWEFCFLEWVQI